MTYQQIRERLIKEVHELLPEHMNRLVWSKEQLDAFQTERLRDILQIAQQKTAWYKETLKNIDPEGFTLGDLRNLPTVDKKDVMNNWDEFVAVTGLTRDKAEGHLERFRNGSIDNPYYKDEYLFIATGGSSGKRGLFIWDREFLKETACINYRFLIDQEIKSNYNGPKRLAVIEAPTLLHGSQHLFTINVTAEMLVKSLSSIDTTDNNCAILNDYQPTYLVGFASSITEMAKAQLRGKLNINPRWITTNSEPMDYEMRASIRQAWGVEPCNSWGSVEIGSIAMETNYHNGMVIGEDGAILELVDNDLNPVADVKDARKVLATSLFNRSMPLIRYVIDDVLNISTDNNQYPAYCVIKSILGRVSDWFIYNNVRIHPMAFRDVLSIVKEIDEYQVEQTETGAVMRFMCNGTPDMDDLLEKIKENLRKEGLADPKLTIEIVDTLPRDRQTGKVKRFVALK